MIPGIHSIDDLFSDDIHLTDVGKYFVACVHFAMIHGRSPVGLTRQLHVWWGGEFQPPSIELARKFQHIAWESVLRYPASCLDGAVTSLSSPPVARSDIYLFPNPAQEMLYLGYAGQDRSVEIYNTLGTRVLSGSGRALRIATLPAGVYHVLVQGTSRRFVKY